MVNQRKPRSLCHPLHFTSLLTFSQSVSHSPLSIYLQWDCIICTSNCRGSSIRCQVPANKHCFALLLSQLMPNAFFSFLQLLLLLPLSQVYHHWKGERGRHQIINTHSQPVTSSYNTECNTSTSIISKSPAATAMAAAAIVLGHYRRPSPSDTVSS